MYIASFNLPQEDSSLWMLLSIGHLAHSPQQPSNLTTVHCHLMFEEDDDS